MIKGGLVGLNSVTTLHPVSTSVAFLYRKLRRFGAPTIAQGMTL